MLMIMSNKNDPVPSIIHRILKFFEKERFGILTLFLWIVALSAIRMWTEAVFLDYPYQEISYRFLFFQAHITSFFIVAYMGGVLLLSFFSKERIARVANLAAIGFLMVLVPPFLDVFFLHSATPYDYISPLQFFEALFTLGTSENIEWGGAGVIFELFGITIATSVYVFIKRIKDGIIKAFAFTVGNIIAFILFFLIIGSPLLMLLRGTFSPGAELIQPLFVVRYLVIGLILWLLMMRVSKKGLFTSFLRSSRLLTTAHFMLMTGIGMLIAGHLGRIETLQLDVFAMFTEPVYLQIFIGNIGMFFLSILAIVFIWQYAVMINHVYDLSIDRIDNQKRLLPSKMLKKDQVRQIAYLYALVSLGLGLLLGPWSLLLVISGLVFGSMYSMPPLRIRDSVFSTSIIGIGSAIAFFLGYSTPAYVKVMHGEMAGSITRIYPEFTMESALIGFLIFIALTIGPLIKDYKDYEGDKKAGVKNLFTIYGLEKGVSITSVLLPIPFFCLLLLFHTIIDIIILVPFGLLAGILFKRFRDTRLVFAIYFPVILYCLLRWFSVITF